MSARSHTALAALTRLTLVALALILLAAPGAAQIVEENLPPETYTEIAYERLSLDELRGRYAAALDALRADPAGPAVLERANELASILEIRLRRPAAGDDAAAAPGSPGEARTAERELLARTLLLAARAHHARGDAEATERALLRVLELDPGFELPAEGGIDADFANRFSALRARSIGRLALSVAPEDARVSVDGRPVDPRAGEVAVVAGTRTVTATRPGFADIVMQLEVQGGRSVPLALELERDSAMLRLVSRPPGARVSVDGRPVGITSGTVPEGYPLPPAAARLPRREISAPLRIGGLSPGSHELLLELEGYRPYRVSVDVPELRDYDAGLMTLEREQGSVVLRGLPETATVEVDGETVRPLPLAGGGGRLDLAPGEHRVLVSDRAAGVFETTLEVVDGGEQQVAVELKPALTLLGVLGGDRVAAGKLRAAIAAAGAGLERWLLVDAAEAAAPGLAAAGVSAEALRSAAADGEGGEPAALDWQRLRAELERRAPGSVYALAVLSDDLLAAHADLWFLPASPAPAIPDRRRVPTHDDAAVAATVGVFDRPLELYRPWLGARLIDSPAAEGPVVAGVVPGGPAAASGLRVGDEIVALLGERVGDAAEVAARLAGRPEGSSLAISVRRGGAAQRLDLKVALGPTVVGLDSPDLVYAAISAYLAALAADPLDGTPEWLIELNRAAVFLHGRAWEDAVRVLRGVRAPSAPGLGQGAADYWLALALDALGPTYAAQARQALERAAAAEGARLFDNDGPLVAPRARARLAGPGGGR